MHTKNQLQSLFDGDESQRSVDDSAVGVASIRHIHTPTNKDGILPQVHSNIIVTVGENALFYFETWLEYFRGSSCAYHP